MQKFYTTVPRYESDKGRYINGTPEVPALITFPDHIKVTADDMKSGNLLTEEQYRRRISGEEVVEAPKPPFVPNKVGVAPAAHSRDRK